MAKTLISVVGPTAIGKTKLAIELANYFNTVIISGDSRQFFKEMRIGTAVPSMQELEAAKHYFIQHKSIFEPYSVGDFEKDALSLLEKLFKKNDIVVMVGGSGLYVDAVTKGLDYFPKIDPHIREKLNSEFETKGISGLQTQLMDLDPLIYSKIDIANQHRIIRALEICIGTGKPYSSFLNKKKHKRPFITVTMGIHAEREVIYNRINKRVDNMLKDGLLEEAKVLYPHRGLNALQTVGYRELFKFFSGEWEKDFAISEIKKNTRRFAKRQLTWYRKNTNIIWTEHDGSFNDIVKVLRRKINLNQ